MELIDYVNGAFYLLEAIVLAIIFIVFFYKLISGRISIMKMNFKKTDQDKDSEE
ncbi:hypothetical protein FHX05_006125 [Rhizobium sp. BK491]|nr:hypothetical protein [Rhizobium sp. BK491]